MGRPKFGNPSRYFHFSLLLIGFAVLPRLLLVVLVVAMYAEKFHAFASMTMRMISAAEHVAFDRNGFVVIPGVVDADEVDMIRDTLDDLMRRRVGYNEGALLDAVSPDGEPGGSPHMRNPSHYAAALRQAASVRVCRELARQLLGGPVGLTYDHFMLKPSRHGAATPWHQDEAFAPANVKRSQVTVWLALDDVTRESGCLGYVAGSHLGPLLLHRSLNEDTRVHFVECFEGFDPGAAVWVPVNKGDCIIHHGRTVHGSGANTSGVQRRSYSLVFAGAAILTGPEAEHPWIAARASPDGERRNAWRRRGGVMLELWHRLRSGQLDWARAAGKIWPGRRTRK